MTEKLTNPVLLAYDLIIPEWVINAYTHYLKGQVPFELKKSTDGKLNCIWVQKSDLRKARKILKPYTVELVKGKLCIQGKPLEKYGY